MTTFPNNESIKAQWRQNEKCKKIHDSELFTCPRPLKFFVDDAVTFDGDIITC